ncbi:MAG: HD-GYP domain-containing protein [Neptuniibacter sp.]
MDKIYTSELQEGMYVDLGKGWLKHPFLKRRFYIKNRKQINKIKEYLDCVFYCPERSQVAIPPSKPELKDERVEVKGFVENSEVEIEPPAPESWEESNKPTERLSAAIQSDEPPENKARAIFTHSTELMDALLSQAPTADLIYESSEAIKDLAGFIVEDDAVSNRLLAITSHDYYTYTHSVNVGLKSLLIAKKILNTNDAELLRELGVGFFLHDIGKSQVDPGILNKPGKLSEDEFEIMKSHPQRGVDLLKSADSLTETARIITVQHHEKVNGSGYPYGLKGKQVHEFGQICALGDIYDALTSERSYKKGMTPFEALYLMKNKMVGHFDDKLFNDFIRLFAEESQRKL